MPSPAASNLSNRLGLTLDLIHVCGKPNLHRHAAHVRPDYIISLLGIEGFPETPPNIQEDRHLCLHMDDIAAPIYGYQAPDIDHVSDIIAFAERWNRTGSVIVHCYAGVSRSMATALILMCHGRSGSEENAAQIIRERAPHAQPNRRLIRIADRSLGCDGRLIRAVSGMGPATPFIEEQLVSLPAEPPGAF